MSGCGLCFSVWDVVAWPLLLPVWRGSARYGEATVDTKRYFEIFSSSGVPVMSVRNVADCLFGTLRKEKENIEMGILVSMWSLGRCHCLFRMKVRRAWRSHRGHSVLFRDVASSGVLVETCYESEKLRVFWGGSLARSVSQEN
jgi:hypothetical protein